MTRALSLLALACALLVGCPLPPAWAPRVLEVDVDAAKVERGRYLAEAVGVCVECHSERDWRYYGGPPTPGTEALGGPTLPGLFLLPDEVVLPAPNITPAALAEWTDGELVRALAGGLHRSGRALFLAHPFTQYRFMSRPDLEALIAWMRSLPPAERELPERDLKYRQVEDIGNAFPAPPTPKKATPEGGVALGRYLVNAAGCRWCHSPVDPLGFPLPGREYSGGFPIAVPPPGGGTVYSTNITGHPTGIGAWSKEVFVKRFRTATAEAARKAEIAPGGFNSPMAWSAYSQMTEDDLGAIYDFLMTVPKVKSLPPRWTPE